MAKGKTEKHLRELFEMWNQEHLDNIALSERIIELKTENANLKKQIYENRIQTGNCRCPEKKTA